MSAVAASPPSRPTAVTIVGWLYVAFGALSVFSGIFGLVISLMLPDFGAPGEMVDGPPPFRIVMSVFDYFGLLAAVQIVAASAAIWGGVAFLRRRAVGRAILEGITWLALIWIVGFGVFWVWVVMSMWSSTPAEPASVIFPAFIALGVVMVIGMAIVVAVILRVLRGPAVRGAMIRT